MPEAQKARNKDEEKEIRDGQQADVIAVDYQKLLEKAEKAAEHSQLEHFQVGFQNRNSKVDAALKRLKDAVKNAKPKHFDTIKDTADIKKYAEELRVAVGNKEAYCEDIVFDVLELKQFCIGHSIFKATAKMTKTADFNNELGVVEFKENK